MRIRNIIHILLSFLFIINVIHCQAFLTKHEAFELRLQIQDLKADVDECNQKYNYLILYILKNEVSNFNVSMFLTPSPYFND